MAPGRPHSNGAQQRTLKATIDCSGVGLHSGTKVAMTLRPAGPDTGIVFKRTDVTGGGASVAARWDNVVDARLNTTIGDEDGVTIGTIEHLMAAFSGAGIDNALVRSTVPKCRSWTAAPRRLYS